MNRTVTDTKRTVAAAQIGEYPDAAEPGQCYAGEDFPDRLLFGCPGCGQFGCIRVGGPEASDSRTWRVVAGSPADSTTLTLTPSILNHCCGWHGHLSAGVFRSV